MRLEADRRPMAQGQAGVAALRQRSCIQVQDARGLACFRGPQEAPGSDRWKVGVGAAYLRQDEESGLAQPEASDGKGRDSSCRSRMEVHQEPTQPESEQ